ncbi:(2Fe-2S)-binding protein [Bartonella sp. LJL80]
MNINVNGIDHQLDVTPDTPLLWVLRDYLGLTGTKFGCGLAQCGACNVLINGTLSRSCVVPVGTIMGQKVTTIEAIEQDPIGKRVVAAWIEEQVPQCGYCQSGQVLTATALLKEKASPTDDDIENAMINLCRCGTYNAMKAAIKRAAKAA